MNAKLKRFFKGSRCLTTFVKSARFCVQDCRRGIWSLVRSQAIKSYFKSYQTRKLHLGSGPNVIKDWLNTDISPTSPEVVFLNATKSFPFEDCVFDYVFSEHLIEHLTYNEGMYMLRECYRVLKPGGRIRIATPSLETIIGLYKVEKSELQKRYIKWITDRYLPGISVYRESFVINCAFQNFEHQFIYDYPTLQKAMEDVGFIDFTCYQAGQSADEVFKGIEHHGKKVGDEDMNKFETMVVEAKLGVK